MRVLLAGGGTAGHIEPALNLADVITTRYPDAQLAFLGTTRGLESQLVPQRGYSLELVTAVPLPRRINGDLFALPFRMHTAVYATRDIIARLDIQAVVGFGGYVSTPAYLAARRRVPIVVHEANAQAGIANRLGARFTRYVGEAVVGSLPNATQIGIPLRASITQLDRGAARGAARVELGLDPNRPCLLVFGGSQGARRINAVVLEAAPALIAAGAQVLHVVGSANLDQYSSDAAALGPDYHAIGYLNGMDRAYAAADVALCRAGAMTCAELAAVGLPAIYVPYAVGNGEQRLNAEPVVSAGGGIILADAEISARRVVESCRPLLADSSIRERMSSAAAQYGVRDGGERLADMVEMAIEAA